MKLPKAILACAALLPCACATGAGKTACDKPEFSGIYPHLAYYNNEGECGTGAVVPWADRLWVITYAPHKPYGSSDKLYEITNDLVQITRPESTGGTPANRMIHKETNQLFIGPYAIDARGNARVISYKDAPGRYTGLARHLTEPANKLYIGTMEAGFYEVDARTLETKTLHKDGNVIRAEKKIKSAAQYSPLLPGCHGKGLYSGQGVMVYSNNGENSKEALKFFNIEAGSLNEWDGKNWTLVRRNQFTEVTGPGGIHGNADPENDPIWSLGWDHKSVLLALRDRGRWHFYRLPKASFSYDGAHGWNTEWPRIRNVNTEKNRDFLMTMHGMFWRLPESFRADNTAGIRPRSAYLKVIGDFARWGDRLVFGCDDSAQREFLNKRKAKGAIEGPGQSNSNLWFTPLDAPDNQGPATASGSVWLDETVSAGSASEAFLFAGWPERCAWLRNHGDTPAELAIEVDRKGDNAWATLKKIKLAPGASAWLPFAAAEKGEWIRAVSGGDAKLTVSFAYASDDKRETTPDKIFAGLATVNQNPDSRGLLYSLGKNRRALGILAENAAGETKYYEMDSAMNIVAKNDPEMERFIAGNFAIPKNVVTVEEGSVLVVDDKGRRWRLPLGDKNYDALTAAGKLRICREVATERDLFNCHGTFYELPAENADGYAKIRPVASHDFQIHDYASYRGLLVMTGVSHAQAAGNKHVIMSQDGQVAVWAGAIDDLWKLGKPTGRGGPWVNAPVEKGVRSDPYLIGHYDRRALRLSHNSPRTVTFTVEVDPTGDGAWVKYDEFEVKAGETLAHDFPDSFQARWIRFSANKATEATAWLEYK